MLATVTLRDPTGKVVGSKSVTLATASAAQFGKIDYSTGTTGPGGLQTMVVQYNGQAETASQIAALRKANPNVTILIYQRMAVGYLSPPSVQGWTAFQDMTAPASFFLHDAAGNPLRSSKWGGIQFLDFSQSVVRQACAKHAISLAQSVKADGVFNDNLDCVLGLDALDLQPAGATACVTSNALYQQAITGWLTELGAAIHAARLKLVGNIGGAWQAPSQPLWRSWNALMDGALEESICFYDTGTFPPMVASDWLRQQQNIAWSEQNGKLTMVNCERKDQASNVFALASMLLVSDGLTCFNVSNGSYGGFEQWFPEYTTAQGLGFPLGPAVQSGGVWSRKFSGGSVSVDTGAHTGTIS